MTPLRQIAEQLAADLERERRTHRRRLAAGDDWIYDDRVTEIRVIDVLHRALCRLLQPTPPHLGPDCPMVRR